MKIISYKKINKDLYLMFLSDGNKYRIYDETILEYDLRINKELTKEDIKVVLKYNDFIRLYYDAIKFITLKDRTTLEVKIFLEKSGIDDEQIHIIISRLTKEKYLDDAKYVSMYLNYSIAYKSSGPKKIEYELRQKGLESRLIKDNMEKIENKIWYDKALKIIKKKYISNKTSNKFFIDKMKIYLLNLGYNLSDIDSIFDEFILNDDEENFKNEANKFWIKLSSEPKRQQISKFQKKMLQRGYSFEQINSYLENII